MSNSLNPDQARGFVGPDLGPNCLPRLSADDTGRQRVNNVYLSIRISSLMHLVIFEAPTFHFIIKTLKDYYLWFSMITL